LTVESDKLISLISVPPSPAPRGEKDGFSKEIYGNSIGYNSLFMKAETRE